MKFSSFRIQNYRAISDLEIKLTDKLIPLIGINECGKTTILQAIYAFDYFNDSEYDGRHLKNTSNLYDTVDYDAIITANVSLKNSEIIEILKTIQKKQNKHEIEYSQNEKPFEAEITTLQQELPLSAKEFNVKIDRNLSKNIYTTDWNYNDILNSSTIKNTFCRELIRYLPYTLYNDDFSDRPPVEIDIPKNEPDRLTGWLAIYERLFKSTNDSYSLFSIISNTDPRRKDSIMSDVEDKLNSTFSTAWRSFSNEKTEEVTVSLKIVDGVTKNVDNTIKNKLQIGIIEKVNGKNRYFNILDRSKGFIWYFNFIMKTQFNPKVVGKVEDTVFLLDEPGAYLHSLAQERLCKKLSEISKSFGSVIFCSHSHHLLNPEIIPLRNMLIVNKNKKKIISVVPVPLYKMKSEKISALQPVYEALQIPLHEVYFDDSIMILVEGINDKYVIELFTNVPKSHKIFPGVSADSICKNIPYMLSYNKNFKALWDNDKEGRKIKNRVTELFHLSDDYLKLLPLQDMEKRRMEDMFVKNDIEMMIATLALPSESNYDVIIPSIHFSTDEKKKLIKEKLNPETKKAFTILEKILFGNGDI